MGREVLFSTVQLIAGEGRGHEEPRSKLRGINAMDFPERSKLRDLVPVAGGG